MDLQKSATDKSISKQVVLVVTGIAGVSGEALEVDIVEVLCIVAFVVHVVVEIILRPELVQDIQSVN